MIRARTGVCCLLLLAGCARIDSDASAPVSPSGESVAAAPTPSPTEVAPAPREVVMLVITPAAARAIKGHAAEMKLERWWFRYTIKGGGCQGFQNKLDLDVARTDEDHEFVVDGVPCLIQKNQIAYVRNVRIDFLNEPGKQGFTVTNERAAQCVKSADEKPNPGQQ
jgi:iron-sulfur cluster assembly accessory protein